MIVVKTWVTLKEKDYPKRWEYDGKGYRSKQTIWEGWFLLGFIPVFVKSINVKYF